MSLAVEVHHGYLADAARIGAFRRALGRTIRPGDVVVDIGAGTAILGMLACEAGAGRVYSIDRGGIVGLAREVVRANRFDDRLTIVKGLSTQVALPERADLVIADQIGRFGFEAGVLEYFSDARARLLKPGARAVPSAISLEVALVEHPATRRRIAFWGKQPAGFSFEPAQRIAENTGYSARLLARNLLSKPAIGATLDTLTHGARLIRFEKELRATRAGTLHGIGGWFNAQLAPGVELTNSPLSRRRIDRANVVFPIARPVKLAKGDQVRVSFSILPKGGLVSWTVNVHGVSAPAARFSHSTFNGMLICQEDLALTRPDFVPVMTPSGRARQAVLEMCDGRRTLREIEEGLLRKHPHLFPGRAEASAFAAEVITRCAT